eukprot:1821259-Rhodomonas_salina.1
MLRRKTACAPSNLASSSTPGTPGVPGYKIAWIKRVPGYPGTRVPDSGFPTLRESGRSLSEFRSRKIPSFSVFTVVPCYNYNEHFDPKSTFCRFTLSELVPDTTKSRTQAQKAPWHVYVTCSEYFCTETK